MKKFLGAMLCAALFGCGADEVTLTQAEAQALASNFGECMGAQNEATELAIGAGLGEADLSGYTYDPPSAGNGWVGTITGNDVVTRFGTGDLLVTFTATGDAGPVDPYVDDLSDDSAVTIDAHVMFNGVSLIGAPLDVDATFTLATTGRDTDTETMQLDGTFDVSHGGYDAHIDADAFGIVYDKVTEEAASVTGMISGTIDLPNFAFDAEFSLAGLGTTIDATLRAGGTLLHILIDLTGF